MAAITYDTIRKFRDCVLKRTKMIAIATIIYFTGLGATIQRVRFFKSGPGEIYNYEPPNKFFTCFDRDTSKKKITLKSGPLKKSRSGENSPFPLLSSRQGLGTAHCYACVSMFMGRQKKLLWLYF